LQLCVGLGMLTYKIANLFDTTRVSSDINIFHYPDNWYIRYIWKFD